MTNKAKKKENDARLNSNKMLEGIVQVTMEREVKWVNRTVGIEMMLEQYVNGLKTTWNERKSMCNALVEKYLPT